jgi:hypothetical protein
MTIEEMRRVDAEKTYKELLWERSEDMEDQERHLQQAER